MPSTASATQPDTQPVPDGEQHHHVAGVLNLLKSIKLPKLPSHAKAKEAEGEGCSRVPRLCQKALTHLCSVLALSLKLVKATVYPGSTRACAIGHVGSLLATVTHTCNLLPRCVHVRCVTSALTSASAQLLTDQLHHTPLSCTAAATLAEVAGIITTLAKDHLASLLVHPGHATVGVYYLAKRHEVGLHSQHSSSMAALPSVCASSISLTRPSSSIATLQPALRLWHPAFLAADRCLDLTNSKA